MAILTIGSSDRQYPDTDAALASLPATLTEQYRLQHYNDSEFTTTTGVSVAGITTTATNNIVLECATGESFRDGGNHLRYDVANGVGIRKTTSYGSVITVTAPHTEIIGIQFSTTGTANTVGLSESTNILLDGCLINSSSKFRATSTQGASSTYVNNVIIVNEGAGNVTRAMGIFYTAPTLVNNTFVCDFPGHTGFGIEKSGSLPTLTKVRNNAIFGFGTAMQSGAWGAGTDYNATDNATLPVGANNLTSLVASDQFENTVSDATIDLRLKAGNSLDGAGIQDALTNDKDIFYTVRAASPSIGAFETSSGGGGVTIDIDTGVIALTGGTLDLQYAPIVNTEINLDTGVLSLIGSQLNLSKNSLISVGTGDLSLSGSNLNLIKDSVFNVDSGSLSFAGQEISLTYTPIGNIGIDLDAGKISLTGEQLALNKSSSINLGAGLLSLTGSELSLLKGKGIDLSNGNLSLAGEALALIKSSNLNIDTGDLSLNGIPLTLTYSGLIVIEVDNFTLSYTNDTIQPSYTNNQITLTYK